MAKEGTSRVTGAGGREPGSGWYFNICKHWQCYNSKTLRSSVFLSVAAASLPSSRISFRCCRLFAILSLASSPRHGHPRRCSVRVPGALLTALVVTSQVSTPAATSWVHPRRPRRRTPPRHPHRRTGALLTAATTSRVSTPTRFLSIQSVGCFADRSPDLTLVVRGSRSIEGYTIAARIKIEGKSSSSLSLSLSTLFVFFSCSRTRKSTILTTLFCVCPSSAQPDPS
jgi:hypothetical protein